MLFKGLGVQKGTETPCWLRPWFVYSVAKRLSEATDVLCITSGACWQSFQLNASGNELSHRRTISRIR